MNTFFNTFNQTISLEELDSFLLKLGSHLATAEPHELAALFQQLTKHNEGKLLLFFLNFKSTHLKQN